MTKCLFSQRLVRNVPGRFFRGTLSQALRARLRSVLSLRDALADISHEYLVKLESLHVGV
jgi:hypothetical protein